MNMMVIGILAVAAVGFIAMIFSRSQALQRFAVMELILVTAVTGGAFWGYAGAERFSAEQYLRFFGVYLQQAYSYMGALEKEENKPAEDELDELLSSILPLTTAGEEQYTYLNAALLLRTGGQYRVVLKSGRDENYLETEESFQTACRLSDSSVSSHTVSYERRAGSDTGYLAVTAPERIAPSMALVVEISMLPVQRELEVLKEDYCYGAAAVLLLGTLFLVTVVVLQGAELRRMMKVMIRVGQGQEEWEQAGFGGKKKRTYSHEMRSMWNSLGQIVAGVARINYEKYRMLQAYYRFAPKEIENLLGKGSILEVKPREQVYTVGVLAVISLAGSKGRLKKEGADSYINRIHENYRILLDAKKAQGGIFLSGSSDLSLIKMMFQEKTRQALHFGIEAAVSGEEAGMGEEDRIFILLHKAGFVYGVAGDEEQASTYLLSDEMELLEKYTERMRSMGIRMAVTGSVYEVIQKEAVCRSIGFIEGGAVSFKLYEVLDAHPARERKLRMDLDGKFQEGLKLFYRDDFYLARKQFTQVLKECPADEVAKWYLFTCEKCLNRGPGEAVSYGFLSDGQS